MLLAVGFQDVRGWNVFMAGDSHVCSKIYPAEVEKVLKEHEGDLDFSYFGKIGAGYYTYNDTPSYMEKIYEARPDVLIVHLGTNDSYTRRFDRREFLRNVTLFCDNVGRELPECKIVLVTPFYNKIRGTKGVNKATRRCADACLDFAAGRQNIYVVDNNATHGMYFYRHRGEMMRPDCVHLTERGYRELGRQVGEALVAMEDLWLIGEPPYLGDEGDQPVALED